jgi:hypothetical protein
MTRYAQRRQSTWQDPKANGITGSRRTFNFPRKPVRRLTLAAQDAGTAGRPPLSDRTVALMASTNTIV